MRQRCGRARGHRNVSAFPIHVFARARTGSAAAGVRRQHKNWQTRRAVQLADSHYLQLLPCKPAPVSVSARPAFAASAPCPARQSVFAANSPAPGRAGTIRFHFPHEGGWDLGLFPACGALNAALMRGFLFRWGFWAWREFPHFSHQGTPPPVVFFLPGGFPWDLTRLKPHVARSC